jgi:hypothetical protein
MTHLSQTDSTAFIDGVLAAVRDSLDALDHHENSIAQLPSSGTNPDRLWSATLNRLNDNLGAWQSILDEMGDKVRVAQDELTALDADLNRALGAFTTARKHLQKELA